MITKFKLSTQTDQGKLPRDIKVFFDFIKALGIIGIFSFHFYDVYLGEGTVRNMLEFGLLKYLLINTKTIHEYICVFFQTFFAFGSMGVEVFIIASGFGLYFSYLSRPDSWCSFYKKRILRIIPLYYLTLLSVFLLTALLLKNPSYYSRDGLKSLFYHFFLLQTFNKSYIYYGALFFIAIIFQLYCIFPVLTRIMPSRFGAIVFFISSLFFSPLLLRGFEAMDLTFSGILLTDYLPHFFAGMMLAYSIFYSRGLHTVIFDPRFSLASLLILGGTVYLTSYFLDYTFHIRMLISFLIFLSMPVLFIPVRAIKADVVIQFTAYASYAFYLIHMPVIKLGLIGLSLRNYPLNNYPAWILLGTFFFMLSIAGAYLLQRWYERLLKSVTSRASS